jgi:hypothetical protein
MPDHELIAAVKAARAEGFEIVDLSVSETATGEHARPSAAERRREHGGALNYYEADDGARIYGTAAEPAFAAALQANDRRRTAARRPACRKIAPARSRRTGTRQRGSGRPAARRTRTTASSGGGDDPGLADESEPPPAGRSRRAVRALVVVLHRLARGVA